MSTTLILKIYKNGKVFAVKQFENDKMTFGNSQSEVDVFLDGEASGVHASIEKRDNSFYICDLGSGSGTYKNGDKILEAELKEGDSITLGEFSIDVSMSKVSAASSGPKVGGSAAAKPKKKAPARKSKDAVAASSGAGLSKHTSTGKTFAPQSPHKNVGEFIKPTKGTLVEVLVAWRERVISAHHFSERGTITVGTHPSCDILVPVISTSVNKVPMVQLDSAAVIILHPGMEGTLVADNEAIPFSKLKDRGRTSGNMLPLQQGEMARVQLGGELELVVRYASQAPKPLLIPFLDLSSNGFLAVLLSIIVAAILSLFVALSSAEEVEKPEQDKYRSALIITNPPKPPPRKKPPPPPKKKKVAKKKVKLKLKPKKVKQKKIAAKSKKKDKGGSQSARGIKRDRTAKALRKTKSKSRAKVGSVKKGGATKTTNKKAAQAQSERKVEKSGLFGVFGSGGKNNRLDTEYGGKGELAGLADDATGAAGFNENRPGEGLGSKFKETGGGLGKSNVGVTGIKGSGKGLGSGDGFGNVGLGDRKGVSVIPGGGGEEYSGQIDKEGIRRVFFNNARAIRSCYERQLNRDPEFGW